MAKYTANFMSNEPASIMDSVAGHLKRNWYRRCKGFSSYEEALAWASEAAWDAFVKNVRITRDADTMVTATKGDLSWTRGRWRGGNFGTTDGGLAYRR